MNLTIAELWLAPCKSVPAATVNSLTFDRCGLFGDREYMWVEGEAHTNETYQKGQVSLPGRFLTQREDRSMTQMTASYSDDLETVVFSHRNANASEASLRHNRVAERADNLVAVSVWSWNGFGVDQGDEAAAWGSLLLGRPVRLVARSDSRPRFVEGDPSLGHLGFSDGFPLVITSVASVAELNRWLSEKGAETVPADRFRANIVLGDVEAFAEDYIEKIELVYKGLPLTLRRVKACGRCPIPDTDQKTGVRKRDVRSVLGKNRRGVHKDAARYGVGKEVFFGQNFIVEPPKEMLAQDKGSDNYATINVGDAATAVLSPETNWVRA